MAGRPWPVEVAYKSPPLPSPPLPSAAANSKLTVDAPEYMQIYHQIIPEDKMVGWHHPLSGHEFVPTSGSSEGQGSLVCCGAWVRRVRHHLATEQQSWRKQINCGTWWLPG